MTPDAADVLQFLRTTVAGLATKDDLARLEVSLARLDAKHDETREFLVRQGAVLETTVRSIGGMKNTMYGVNGDNGLVVDVANLKKDAERQERRYYQVLVPLVVAVAGAFFAVVFSLMQRWFT